MLLLGVLKTESGGTPSIDLMEAGIVFANKDYKKALQLYHALNKARSVEVAETLGNFYLNGDTELRYDYLKVNLTTSGLS